MSDAGNAEPLLKVFKRLTYVMVFLIIFAPTLAIVNILFPTSNAYADSAQRTLIVLSVSSFTTLVISMALHVALQSRTTWGVLLMSCTLFIITYYTYLGSRIISSNLSVTPYPLFIELKNGARSVYVLDLPQIIVVMLVIYYLRKRRSSHISKNHREGYEALTA
ncbi:MAG: hypothetical protein QW116_04645 [Zestosphaera sp.]